MAAEASAGKRGEGSRGPGMLGTNAVKLKWKIPPGVLKYWQQAWDKMECPLKSERFLIYNIFFYISANLHKYQKEYKEHSYIHF